MEGIQTGSTIKVLNVSQLQKMRIPLYDTTDFFAYGDELKKNEISYRKQMKKITETYEGTKGYFLEMLKKERGAHEEDIY